MNSNKSNVTLRECMSFYNKEQVKLIELSLKKGLGEYYDGLRKYYYDIFFEDPIGYKLFNEETSIQLLELFLIIIWNSCSEKDKYYLESRWQNFTTLSSYLEYINNSESINLRRKVHFIFDFTEPDISVISFQNILLNNSLISYTSNKNNTPVPQTIYTEILNTIILNAFAHSTDAPQYIQGSHIKIGGGLNRDNMNSLINKIYSSLAFFNKTDKCYVMSPEFKSSIIYKLSFSKEKFPFENIFFKKTGEEELFEKWYFGLKGDNSKYYFTVKVHFNKYTDTAKIIPFVFLPQLDEKSYITLKEMIFSKWGIKPKFLSSQLEYELIQLYLNQSLLLNWANSMRIKINLENYNLTKVAINFGLNLPNSRLTKEEFQRLNNLEYLLNWNDLIDVLNQATKDSQPLISSNQTNAWNEIKELSSFMPNTSPNFLLPQDTTNDVKMYMENLVYSTATLNYIEFIQRFFDSGLLKSKINKDRIYVRKFGINFDCFLQHISKETSVSLDEIIYNLWNLIEDGFITLNLSKSTTSLISRNSSKAELIIKFNNYAQYILSRRYNMFLYVLSNYVYRCSLNISSSDIEDAKLLNLLIEAKKENIIPGDTNIDYLLEQLISFAKVNSYIIKLLCKLHGAEIQKEISNMDNKQFFTRPNDIAFNGVIIGPDDLTDASQCDAEKSKYIKILIRKKLDDSMKINLLNRKHNAR